MTRPEGDPWEEIDRMEARRGARWWEGCSGCGGGLTMLAVTCGGLLILL
jgi:hypothetical protein